MEIAQLNDIIKCSKNILLVSHINPDGDTLGSMCGMYNLIKDNYKKKCDMCAISKIPATYEFIPNISDVRQLSKFNFSRVYDLVINLDVAAMDRCDDAQILFNKAKHTVNIDHHRTNTDYAQLNFVDSNASATGEVLFGIAQNLNWKISYESAVCLYTAIMTDTGGFRFSNTTSKTLEYASKLLSIGVSPSDIYQKCYESYSKDRVLFQSYCLNKAKFSEDNKIAYMTVYKKDLEKFNHNGEDFTDGLTEKLRTIKTTEIAFVIKELNSTTSKLSMRAKSADISRVCLAFDGGGHKLAAGAVIKENVAQAVKSVLNEIKKQGIC